MSGQGTVDPATGRLSGPDVESQTEQVFKNIETILKAAGSEFQHILRCGVFLQDIAEFSKMNAVYERVMAGHRPARTTVQVAALPSEGLRVEIDAIAYGQIANGRAETSQLAIWLVWWSRGVPMVIRWTTVTLLLAATLFGVSACNIPGKKPDGPPIYALLRLRHMETRVEMLIMMETFGDGTCEAALSEFTRAIYENEDGMQGWKETERDCREALKPLYTRIFNDEQVHATYLKITVKEAWQYESRIILYGIPASQAQPVCQEIARDLQGKLQARAECVQGTEG